MVSQQSFEKLTAMGITLYQQRDNDEQTIENNAQLAVELLKIEKSEIDNQFFQDVLLALNLSIGDITLNDNKIDLGLFNWFFGQEKQLSFEQNKLITPALSVIQASPELKKQLWHVLDQI